MREHEVYEALERYLQAAIAASVAAPEELQRHEALVHEARLRYQNALEAFHMQLQHRRIRDFALESRGR
jgi:hypothetical protein